MIKRLTTVARRVVRHLTRPQQISMFCVAENGDLYLVVITQAVDTEQNRQHLLQPYFGEAKDFGALGPEFDDLREDGLRTIFEYCRVGEFLKPDKQPNQVMVVAVGHLNAPDFTLLHLKSMRSYLGAYNTIRDRLEPPLATAVLEEAFT